MCLRLLRRFLRVFLFFSAEQVVEVGLAVLVLDQIGSQPIELDLVHDDLPGEQRNQRQRNPHVVESREILIALELRQARFAQVNAELREQHEPDVALNGQRTLGLFLDQVGDLRLVLVRIERCGDERECAGKQKHNATRRNQNPLQPFHGHYPALHST